MFTHLSVFSTHARNSLLPVHCASDYYFAALISLTLSTSDRYKPLHIFTLSTFLPEQHINHMYNIVNAHSSQVHLFSAGNCEQHCHHKKKYSCFKDVSNCHKYTICERVDVTHYKYYWKQYCGHCGKKYWSQSRQKCTTKKPRGCYSDKAETWKGSYHYGTWPSRYGKLNCRFTRRSPFFHR